MWTAAVCQPVNSRVRSVRGLPELVRLELVCAMGRPLAEQVRLVTGGMRLWIDQVRAAGVHSVTEFDRGLLDGIGDKDHVCFAVDIVTLAYDDRRSSGETTPETCGCSAVLGASG